MIAERYEIESKTPFAESLIWQLNRNFYQEKGISAWSENIVPHQMTSSSLVGKTYAELIFAFLKDLASKGKNEEVVYILELGAGHGRLAYHVLRHLEKQIKSCSIQIPPYCYVLSDIVEENLSFFQSHPQFQEFIKRGLLDVSYFDANESTSLILRHAKKTIQSQDLNQPILGIANYFFDSLPNELYYIEDQEVSACSVSIHSKKNLKGLSTVKQLKNMEFLYNRSVRKAPIYNVPMLDAIIEDYRHSVSETYVFFPKLAIECLHTIQDFSKEGMVLLTMDKGFHEIHNLEHKKEPEIITHGSFSIWVNYHALSSYCTNGGGKVMFPSFSNVHFEIGCLMFLEDGESYIQTEKAYQQSVNDFGPDDFNSIKKMAYNNASRIKLPELLALFRLSAYDSSVFTKLLPRLKQVSQPISFNERKRIAQTLDCVWEMYFSINDSFDLAYEIAAIFYDLGYYTEALHYFKLSVEGFGLKADTYYNQALCHYQLKEDALFFETLQNAKEIFPEHEIIRYLENLDMAL